ncbi:MAG: efflux RND transporter periplasmic adaptor subunit [Dongiaceae bacterium]
MPAKKTSGSFPVRGAIGFLVLWLVLGMALALSACDKPRAEAAQAGVTPPPPQVGIITVTSQHVSLTSELPGRTAAYQVSEVRPQVGGIVQKRLFQEGSDVKAGQVLYQIDPATYQAAYDSAKATLAKAKANLTSIRSKADRYKELVSIDAVSRQDYDDAAAAAAAAEADIDADQAALESARINLNYTKVTAPISGRIGKSVFTPGALVTAGQADALALVQQLDPIYVDVTQSTADVLRLRRELANGRLQRAGDNQAKVKLVLEDGTPYDQEGSLQFSDITVDQTTGSITLRAVFPNPNHDLLPGMYVRALLEEGVDDDAILVPQRGVSRDIKGNPTAMVVEANGMVGQRILKTERALGDQWLVSNGLKAGDRLIVDGLQRIRPGMQVTPVDATASAAAPAASTATP